jgi:integrase
MTYYELNDVPLSKKKIYRYLGEEERPIENRGYNTEEISKMLEVCDERARAIILVLASTGIRIRAILDLKLEDLIIVPDLQSLPGKSVFGLPPAILSFYYSRSN